MAALLYVAGNDPLTSSLRRNKFEQHQALLRAGLPIPVQARVSSLQDLDAFVSMHYPQLPDITEKSQVIRTTARVWIVLLGAFP